ncbi:MAG TPA: phosphoribosylamine--glycine ligase [Cyclobacteriaceae bacterium]|jgi:phosphoribosylamine--glycine ligase|nr:phosphoribosylamine--glycine ligase [Cyclobacteriaceae bacterium]
MRILIIGSGGREHAFAWKLSRSPNCDKLFVAPGNAGTAQIATNVPIAVDDFKNLGRLCIDQKIDLVLVGPEVPLVKGIRNYFGEDERLKNILMVGPSKEGAQLEGSKDFSKQFMLRHGVPTAKAKTFFSNQTKEAERYLEDLKPPYVLKADGLAAGKGVIISVSLVEAKSAIREMLEDKKFGEASAKVLIEEFLDGIELSVFVVTDGKDYVILPEAKDYKRIGDGDTGPNTGGMGSVSPVSFADKAFMKKVEEDVVRPTIDGLKKENISYKGFIFIGLMNVNGEPYVIEYNARMGDPETQSVMMRIKSDLVDLLAACAKGELKNCWIEVDPSFVATVVMAAGGYPDQYEKGKVISGIGKVQGAQVFHAGTKASDKNIVTDGGRVLAVTASGNDMKEAIRNSYEAVGQISWDNSYFRKDIGQDVLRT